jgi:uncharacterized protein
MKIATLLRDARRSSGFTQTELAARAGTSQPAVNRYERGAALPSLPTLERLVRAAGRSLVVETSPRPRPGLVSARSGIGAVASVLRLERARILQAAVEHGARNVRVFGSVARGEEHGASDVDLLVDLAPERTLLDLVGLRLALEDLLVIDVDVTTLDMLKPTVRETVLREAVPL